jgi:hypothetical protein
MRAVSISHYVLARACHSGPATHRERQLQVIVPSGQLQLRQLLISTANSTLLGAGTEGTHDGASLQKLAKLKPEVGEGQGAGVRWGQKHLNG